MCPKAWRREQIAELKCAFAMPSTGGETHSSRDLCTGGLGGPSEHLRLIPYSYHDTTAGGTPQVPMEVPKWECNCFLLHIQAAVFAK